MKAIIENGKIYKVTGERGDFFITELNGKVKMFAKRNFQLVEVEEIKEKVYKKMTMSKKDLAEKQTYEEKIRNMSKSEFEAHMEAKKRESHSTFF